jgi:ABC-2 type transport system ATP-binding protein
MLSIKNVSIIYEKKLAVNEASVDITPAKITGLIGPNGAGKSSLLKACVGLINEFAGTIEFDGREIRKRRFWVKQHCGFAPEDVVLMPYLKGSEFLELIAVIRKVSNLREEIDFLIDLTGLQDKKDELIINYSHGMRQKLFIASALTGKPEYLILDEALNGLDTISLFKLKNYLNDLAKQGKTIIISSHILPLIKEWCDPVVIMNNGTIINKYSVSEIEELENQTKQSFESIFVDLIEQFPSC